MKRTVAGRSLLIATLACVCLYSTAGLAAAATDVQGSNSSNASRSSTGNTTGTNSNTLTGGVKATGTTGASAQQNGHNAADVTQKGKTKTGDAVAGAQVVGAVADDVTVQLQNTATDPFTRTGTSTLTNTATVALGPVASGSQAQQNGDNDLAITQDADVTTGDAVSGDQVTGIVGDGTHRVQNQNNVACALLCALSGDALTNNIVGSFLGPNANPVSTTDSSRAAQIGDNDATISQAATEKTGDALNGAQVTGIVGGNGVTATVQNQNHSVCTTTGTTPCAQSGASNAAGTPVNAEVAFLGPLAASGTTSGTGQAAQTGNNSLNATQNTDVSTGDALSGSQVTGMVAGERGHLTVQNQQASEGDAAVTGIANGVNASASLLGPKAGGITTSEASQLGDNDLTLNQTTNAVTGDAVAGSQVTGAVAGSGSDVTVQNQNTANAPTFATGGAIALSGNAIAAAQVTGVVTGADSTTTVENQNTATGAGRTFALSQASFGPNFAAAFVGPVSGSNGNAMSSQTGSDTADVSQNGNDAALLALDAGPVSGGFGIAIAVLPTPLLTIPTATTSQATLNGDTDITVSQIDSSSTGDAVAGSQVTGSVTGDGSTTTVQNQNTAVDAFASTAGNAPIAVCGNAVATICTPQAAALVGGPVATATGVASGSQIGDDTAAVTQSGDALTGDAVAGSQVTGTVGGKDASVQVQNTSSNVAGCAGPCALTGIAVSTNAAAGQLGPLVNSTTAQANAEQAGNTDGSADQALTSKSGDAVDGDQITGRVG